MRSQHVFVITKNDQTYIYVLINLSNLCVIDAPCAVALPLFASDHLTTSSVMFLRSGGNQKARKSSGDDGDDDDNNRRNKKPKTSKSEKRQVKLQKYILDWRSKVCVK